MDWDVAHWANQGLSAEQPHSAAITVSQVGASPGTPPPIEHVPVRRFITFGITQQFRFHH
jgi:hypothetical protein